MIVRDHENIHELLYRAHWSITGGGKHIHDVIVALYAASRHADTRAKLIAIIAKLEEAMDASDEAWRLAGDARSELTALTGCDGKCSDRALWPAELPTDPHHGGKIYE